LFLDDWVLAALGLSLKGKCHIVVGGSRVVEGVAEPFQFNGLGNAARVIWTVPILTCHPHPKNDPARLIKQTPATRPPVMLGHQCFEGMDRYLGEESFASAARNDPAL